MGLPDETSLQIPGYRYLQDGQHISRLEGNGNYTILHLTNQARSLLVSQTLKRFELHFPHFIRISKSVMVNPDYVEQVVQANSRVVFVKLTDGLFLPVSRRRILETRIRLGQS